MESVQQQTSTSKRVWIFIFSLFLIYAAFLFGMPAYKYHNMGLIVDINHFSEAFSTAARGKAFHNHSHYWQMVDQMDATLDPHQTASLFGVHFRPFFYLMLPFYKIVPSVYTLFLFQALLVASSVFAVFLLCRERMGSVNLSLLTLLVFVCHPLSTAVSTAFFPSFMAIPLLLWAIYFIEKNKMLALCVMVVLVMSLKEILAAPAFVCGIYCMIRRSKIVGVGICVVSAIYLLLCLEYIIPMFSITNQYNFYHFYSDQNDISLVGAITNMLDPGRIIDALFRTGVQEYLGNMFAPLLFLPLLSPVTLLAVPLFAQNILAVDVEYALYTTGHLSSPILPFIFFGFIITIAKIKQLLPEKIVKIVVVISLFLSMGFSVSILYGWDYRDDVLKGAVAAVSPHMEEGDIVAFAGADSLHTYFSDKQSVTFYEYYKNARWNAIYYNAEFCGDNPKKYTDEEFQKDLFIQFSLDACRMIQDDCYNVYFNENHSADIFYPGEEDFKLLIVENKCTAKIPEN